MTQQEPPKDFWDKAHDLGELDEPDSTVQGRRIGLALMAISAGLVIWGIVMLCSTLARAHSFYEATCCSGLDCRPVADAAITEGPNGYVINATGEVIGYGDKRIRQSPDQSYHWCSVGGKPDTKTICLYSPGKGF